MGPKVGQKWVFGCKSGLKCVKTHFCTHLNPFRDIHENPLLTQFKGGGNCCLKTALTQSRPSINLELEFLCLQMSLFFLQSIKVLISRICPLIKRASIASKRVKTFISCYRFLGPQKGFRRVSEGVSGEVSEGVSGGFSKGFRRVLEGVNWNWGPVWNPSKTLLKPFRDPFRNTFWNPSETLLGSGGSAAGNESLDKRAPIVSKNEAENGPFGTPFLTPKIPSNKFMWVPLLRPFPGNEAGAQNRVFWVGAKKFTLKKFMCFFGPRKNFNCK